ncbi:UDP-N-acetylgalactosamine-undecaprenyl-phosphate N-acetylgalactosaminephosphotransferase [Clostridium tepidiprofundi DSM 19306]|uniref:UDP-N-acetylgalactosamine-undecaprenyl-phosphate N-acetylgalactosaminephosphotransferase n=1 Tax=Clostridium tepidiprofundi DSM 19306 TaxID=1121338 RepID=A0A151AU98_9CLOT|nr:sugar transferase [Clostridium tepidiprofundi]KYH31215.1 UDP-N-acetylgalactosamine-undecaprenyl-phosphate N-acetylgalactosaminephosphotransferase [Clostridium tepidiprofundi DSM 19306]
MAEVREGVSLNTSPEVLGIEHSLDKPVYEKVKRLLDIILCLIAFPIGVVLVILAAIFIKIESKGSIFYSQERLGKSGKKFKLYKLRSMSIDAEKNGVQWAKRNDPRVTKVGKVIRKTRIDEIPQIWNILKGDMAIVGPRPEREVFYDKFENEGIPFRRRLLVTPGLTGLAQVNGGYDMSPEEKLEWDMVYMRERNFIMDMKIIFKTVTVVFTGSGAR